MLVELPGFLVVLFDLLIQHSPLRVSILFVHDNAVISLLVSGRSSLLLHLEVVDVRLSLPHVTVLVGCRVTGLHLVQRRSSRVSLGNVRHRIALS